MLLLSSKTFTVSCTVGNAKE